MNIDWRIVSSIVSPTIALFTGVWVDRRFGDRPKLITFYGHVSAFKIHPQNQPTFDLFTHAVVIRNAGRKAATHVRVSHHVLPPDVTVYPDIEYTVIDLPEGGREMVFPALVPNEQITISYAYAPPLTYERITTRVRSDDGFAKVVNVIQSVPAPRWVRLLGTGLMVTGGCALLYALYDVVRKAVT